MPYIKKLEAESVKQQICVVYNNNNGDWKGLANTLGVKKSTAYRWVKNQDNLPKPRGGKRNMKITEEHRTFMIKYIEENSRITLKDLKLKMEQNHQIIVSTECLRKHLDGLMYTLKDIRREPEKMNSDGTKTKRREYVLQLLNYQADNIPILYMDETNFNLFISRKKGRSKKGTRCSYITAGNRGANVHVIGCISAMGLIHHQIRRGSFRKEEAKEFVRQCLRAALTVYHSYAVLVIDNAPCHCGVEEIFIEEEFSNHHLLRPSPYSPMFNPIENAWSSLKAAVKRDLCAQMPQILADEDRANISQTEFRLRQLENIINQNIDVINANNCARYVAHVQRFIPDALNLEDMVM